MRSHWESLIKPFTIVNDDNFDEKVLESSGLAVVVFVSDWSPSCRNLLRDIESSNGKFNKTADFFIFPTDIHDFRSSPVLREYNIQILPFLLVFEDGCVGADCLKGYQNTDEVINWLTSNILYRKPANTAPVKPKQQAPIRGYVEQAVSLK